MKKSILNCLLLSTLLLVSCNGNNNNSNSNENSSELESSSSQNSTQSVFKDGALENNVLKMPINDSYYIPYLLNDQYQNSFIDVIIDDKNIAKFEIKTHDNEDKNEKEYDYICGLKTGSTKATIIIDETYEEEFTITVTEENAMDGNFKTGIKNLYGKSFTVFGDSISEISYSNYKEWPDFWCDQLVSKYEMTMYNYAIGGATIGYCRGNESHKTIVGTYVIKNNMEARKNLEKSDYAFIYFGNNDFSYRCIIGELGDVNDENYGTKESFKGSYSYLIDEIRKCNPTIKIVCLSLSYSTWPLSNNISTPEGQYCKTRSDMRYVVKEIAEAKNCKYIDVFDLWNGENYAQYIPDGMHPQTAGYELIVNRILEN